MYKAVLISTIRVLFQQAKFRRAHGVSCKFPAVVNALPNPNSFAYNVVASVINRVDTLLELFVSVDRLRNRTLQTALQVHDVALRILDGRGEVA